MEVPEEIDYYNKKLSEARQRYFALQNDIDILEQKKNFLLRNTYPDYPEFSGTFYSEPASSKRAKSNNYRKSVKKVNSDRKNNNKEMPAKCTNENEYVIRAIGGGREILDGFVDRVAERSLHLYRNNNCHTCSKLLEKGISTKECPKHHELDHLTNN